MGEHTVTRWTDSQRANRQPFTSADKSGTIFVRQTKNLYHALTQTYKHTPAGTTHSHRAHSHSLDGLAASTQALTTYISREDVGTKRKNTYTQNESTNTSNIKTKTNSKASNTTTKT